MLNAENPNLYHNPAEVGYWTGKIGLLRNIALKDGTEYKRVAPVGIEEQDKTLKIVLSHIEGKILVPIDELPGLKVVKGDSSKYPYEKDNELLIEINYLKMDEMEDKPRRIRPTGIKFGILGDIEEASAQKGGHRAMGESADFYLEGIDTQYEPGESGTDGLRFFPFWRIGVWGNAQEMSSEFLPKPQPIQK